MVDVSSGPKRSCFFPVRVSSIQGETARKFMKISGIEG